MWSTQKPVCELRRLRDCRSILDSMTETRVLYITSHIVIHFILVLDYFVYAKFACKQVEWTPYITSPRGLLNEHPRTAFIGGITFFWYRRGLFTREDNQTAGFCTGYSPPLLRPTHNLQPAQGTYSMSFASPLIYIEAWSRFPYCARVGDQALHQASVPSEAVLN